MSGEAVKQALANQLKNLENSTGKSVAEWTKIINDSALIKHGELVAMLKEKYGLGHGNANALVHSAKESHAAATNDDEALITEQYKGKEELKAWYDQIIKKLKSFGSDIDISPKKAYVSVRRKKQFAILQPSTKTRLDIGLNLKNVEAGEKLTAAGSWNTMCSHRIKLERPEHLDEEVFESLQTAYDQAG